MITIVTETNRARLADALDEMHRQRKAVFVDRMNWRLDVKAGREIDAYDRRDTVYLLSMKGDTLLSSVRLLPTTRAHLMSDLFPRLCPGGVPRGPAIREASRFCVSPVLKKRAARREQLWQIIAGILETGLRFGIEQVSFVAGSALLPLALEAGWQARTLGPAIPDGSDRVTAVAAEITAGGLDAVRRRHDIVGPVIRATSRHAAA